jgi:glycine/D-amino acid oxidase-like deaminating enzyme
MILATRPLTAAAYAAAGWTDTTPAHDLLNLHHYFRLLPDGRFLFGGRAGNSARPSALARQAGWLEAAFRRYYPAWQDVEITHRWSGFVCLAADRLPHVGAWDDEPGIYYALAYSGTGIALGSWAGQAIASVMRGERDADLRPKLMRRPPPRFPLPFLRLLYQRYFYHKLALDDAWRR